MNTHYDVNTGAVSGFNWWIVTTIIFMIMAAFLGFVAWHNTQPIHCTRETYDSSDNVWYCEIPEN